MELNKLHILIGKTSPGHHSCTIPSASVGSSAGEVSSAVATSGQDGVVGPEAVDVSILKRNGSNTLANSILHNEILSKVFDEIVGVIVERSAIQGVQHGMASSVSHTAGPVGLATLAKIYALPTKGSLVDLAIVQTAEWHAVIFQL